MRIGRDIGTGVKIRMRPRIFALGTGVAQFRVQRSLGICDLHPQIFAVTGLGSYIRRPAHYQDDPHGKTPHFSSSPASRRLCDLPAHMPRKSRRRNTPRHP